MALSNRYASLERRDVRSPSSYSTSTPRKTASGNCCKNFWGPKGHIKSYGIFEPGLWSGAQKPQPHRVAIPHLLQGKRCPHFEPALWSRAKSPWSDRVVIPFLLQGKQRLETLVKIWGRSNDWIKSDGPFELVLWSRAKRTPPHRVAIPHLLQGKRRLETCVKIWGRSNGRINSCGPFEPVLSFWSAETCTSLSSDCTSTPRKTASGNSC